MNEQGGEEEGKVSISMGEILQAPKTTGRTLAFYSRWDGDSIVGHWDLYVESMLENTLQGK